MLGRFLRDASVLVSTLCVSLTMCAQTCTENQQPCDKDVTIYENRSSVVNVVSLELRDACPDADSYVVVWDKPDADPNKKKVAEGTIPDMGTRLFTFDVPPAAIIKFNCRGKGNTSSTGQCSWRILSAGPHP
jgi:hypothetical protein